ncbi:MAG: bifunctional adenosylcobinamide kinase/adenosylcobinamide-phosphate guanylyltransferase [Acidimicrobiales bacterium]
MMLEMLTLLLGGARSGKSALAVSLAQAHPGASTTTFLATAEPRDEEMMTRVAAHRQDRPQTWRTLEEPLQLAQAFQDIEPSATVVLDCLTLWVSNMMEAGWDDVTATRSAEAVSLLASERPGLTVAVSNEVGSGIVPAEPVSRRYRDLLGRVNSIFADHAFGAFLVVAGRLLALQRPPEGVVPL